MLLVEELNNNLVFISKDKQREIHIYSPQLRLNYAPHFLSFLKKFAHVGNLYYFCKRQEVWL